MTMQHVIELLQAADEGRTASQDTAGWIVEALEAWLHGDDLCTATGLTLADRREYWLARRNAAILEAWRIIDSTLELGNHQSAHALFDALNGEDLGIDLDELLDEIHLASEQCGHLGSGGSIYNVVVDLVLQG